MIELRGVGFGYAEQPVLRDVDLALDEGELVVVSGRTGVGKSTLLGVLTGLVPRFTGGTLSGDVLIDGRSVVHEPPRERAHLVGYVGQDPAAGFVTDTVEEELAYGMEQLGLAPDTMRRRVEETLDLLGVAALRSRDLRTLSGGEQQRVAIGSVLTMHPRVLVLDEPTSALDPTAAEEVLATLTRLVHDLGLSVLMAEHRLERVVPFADRMVLLTGDGTIRAGEPAEILAVSPVVPPIVELGRRLGWYPLPVTVRDARRLARGLDLGPPPTRPCAGVRRAGRGGRRRSRWSGARPSPSGRERPAPTRQRDRPDGPQRLRQVDAPVDPPGQPRAPGRTGDVSGADPASRRRPRSRRALVGLVPQTAADLLYLESVADECAGGGRRLGGGAQAARPPGARRPRRHPPARPVRGAAPRAGAGRGAGRCAARAAPRRADARARLPGQGRARGRAPRARRRRPRGDGGDPRRGVRRRGRRRRGGAGRGRGRLRRARPARCSRRRRRSPRRSPRSSARAGCGSRRCRDEPAARRTAGPTVRRSSSPSRRSPG